MIRRLTPLLIILSLLPAIFAVNAAIPAPQTAVTTNTPPLPGSCVTGGMPPGDYNQPVCCASGYVYLNGQPAAGAKVTVTNQNGDSVTVTTALTGTIPLPHYTVSLDTPPLNVAPSQTITIHVNAAGQTKTQTFTVHEGGQQIDIVLPVNEATAAWQPLEMEARQNHDLVRYDALNSLYSFGGSSASPGGRNDGWLWNGVLWLPAPPSDAPSPRYTYRMAYDAARQVIILFGGFDGSASLGDTWEWDGAVWTEKHPAQSPPARHAHAMAYDPVSETIILFGGMVDGVGRANDTWAWDGVNWTQQFPVTQPASRSGHSMTSNGAAGRILLFGGRSNSGLLADSWLWDGANGEWVQKFPTNAPSAREEHELAAAANGRLLLFGGIDDSAQRLNDTWIWEYATETWTAAAPLHSPPPRSSAGMAYDPANGYTLLSGGAYGNGVNDLLADSWAWDGGDWTLLHDASAPPPAVYNALGYKGSGQSILSGGKDSASTWYTQTYQLENNQWRLLSPATSLPPRIGHRLVGNQDGSQLLTIGGLAPDGRYLNDTWVWQNDNWINHTPPLSPPPRAFYSLAYDSDQNVWLLFGGYNGVDFLDDLWQYDGASWQEITFTGERPSPRKSATLTYDPRRALFVLFGGYDGVNRFNETWELDAAGWTKINPAGNWPAARYAHAAAYDSLRQTIVIASGIGGSVLTDTWTWDGSVWRQRSTANTGLRAYGYSLIYDAENDWLIASGGSDGGSLNKGGYLHRVFTSPAEADPIATINRIRPRDARQGIDVITFQGSGADADATDNIAAYEWSYAGTTFSSAATFTTTADIFPLGVQTVTFRVQDDEGVWSAPVKQTIYIRNGSGGSGDGATWTHLIYAVADNNLDAWLGDYYPGGMLYRLRTSPPQDGVETAVLYDGPGINDTYRYILDHEGNWQAEHIGEARMDDPETLAAFITWGYAAFDTDYYAVSLADHANGVWGIGQDNSSSNGELEFLTPLELRSAFQEVTDDGARKIDIVHFDGCSFGLFEDAAIVHGLAAYVVASPNTAWAVFPYDSYRQAAGLANNEPRDYAIAMGEIYAGSVARNDRPYTISVMDMAYFDALRDAVSDLGNALLAYTSGSAARRELVRVLRYDENSGDNTQLYDSGHSVVELEAEDEYVDLTHWALRVRNSIPDTAVTAAATAVLNVSHPAAGQFIPYESAASGSVYWQGNTYAIDLENAYGLGIYYPPYAGTAADSVYNLYITNHLFDVTRDSGWRSFIAALPAQSPGSGDDGGELLSPLGVPSTLFLPVVIRSE
jgi:hypothetical protein